MVTSYVIPSLFIVTLTLATATQLETLAQQTSDKAIAQATDATNAIDCAYEARPLTECSPNLFSHDVHAEIDQLNTISKDLQKQQQGHLAKLEG